MSNCDRLGIPAKLHTGDRPVVPEFNSEEKIWRRFPPLDSFLKPNIMTINGIKKPKLSVFPFKVGGMSCNREQFSEPADVLYNVENANHFFNWAIFQLIFNQYDGSQIDSGEILKTFHVPTECMYPHVEIWFTRGGEKVNEIPDELKIWVRKKLQDLSQVIKE